MSEVESYVFGLFGDELGAKTLSRKATVAELRARLEKLKERANTMKEKVSAPPSAV